MLARALLLAAAAAAAAPSGCEKIFGDGSQNAHAPGTDLGTFHVSATVTSNTCGAGALGQQDAWEFDVSLQRGDGILFWNNGQAAISGTLAGDEKGFTFDTYVVQDMRDPEHVGLFPCSIQRTDHASGTLDSAGDDVSSFTGELSYTFTPTTGSTCDDLVAGNELAMNPIVAALPCAFSYSMKGEAAKKAE